MTDRQKSTKININQHIDKNRSDIDIFRQISMYVYQNRLTSPQHDIILAEINIFRHKSTRFGKSRRISAKIDYRLRPTFVEVADAMGGTSLRVPIPGKM